MKGEVSISNWYLGDPKQTQLGAVLTWLSRTALRTQSRNLCVTRGTRTARSNIASHTISRFNHGK